MKNNHESSDELPERQKKKWNYVFLESLKMALFLPLIILAVEVFLLDSWPDWRDRYLQLAYDYLFLFSLIFLIFVIFHLIRWHRYKRFSNE